MNVYTCTAFRGHWPVGTAAVIVAGDALRARALLDAELVGQGLEPTEDSDEFVLLKTRISGAYILCNGDY